MMTYEWQIKSSSDLLYNDITVHLGGVTEDGASHLLIFNQIIIILLDGLE